MTTKDLLLCMVAVLLMGLLGVASFASEDDEQQERLNQIDKMVYAAGKGKIQTVKEYLAKGINIDSLNSNDMTALMYASFYNQIEMVKFLLENGADPTFRSQEGDIASEFAIKKGSAEILELLIRHGEDVSQKSLKNHELLYHANVPWRSDLKYEDKPKVLLRYGARPTLYAEVHPRRRGDKREDTPLMAAAVLDLSKPLKYMIAYRADINYRDSIGRTALHFAVISGDTENVKILIQNGADIDATDDRGGTPLIDAVGVCKYEIIRYLLEKGADVSIREESVGTALDRARGRKCKNKKEIVNLLQKHMNEENHK